MNVLLINTNRNQSPMPVIPLGACMVAEATEKAGHEVTFLDLMFETHPVQAIEDALKRCSPEVVGFSVRNIDNNDMLNPAFYPEELLPLINTIVQRTDSPIVLGGAAVSVMAEQLLRFTGASWAVLGEGEKTFPELLNHLENGTSPDKLSGIAWLENEKLHYNTRPRIDCSGKCAVPEFHHWIDSRTYKKRMSTAPLQTKLGCHFQCVYCTYRKIEGGTYRLLEPKSTVEAVNKLVTMGFDNIEFVDNVFNSPYEHCLAVCEELTKANHSSRLQTYELNPLFLDDDLIAIMERAGFVGAGITVESASSKVLARLKKGYSADEVYNAADVMRRHQLPCIWIFMLGGPGETQETVQETLHFAKTAIRPTDAAFFTTGIRIYPGTELENIARQQGVLDLPAAQMLEPVFYVSPEVELEWLIQTVRKALNTNMNFISGDTIGLPFLPSINRFCRQFGIQPPLWRYSRYIRRGLRLFGVNA